jgi:hypothetical protein
MSGLESHMTHIRSGRNLSTFDNESGSRMYYEISRSVNDRITCQSNSITPDNLFKLRRKKAKSSKSVPAELLTELALLWRTIGILRYSVGVPGVLTSFYADLLTKIVDVEPLSLSNFSNDNIDQDYVTQQHGHDGGAISIGLTNADSLGYTSTTAIKPSKEVIFAVPELEYLQENSGFEGDEINDPLGVVQKLFNSSESFASSVPIAEKGAMHSVCLALAVKSGRLSLLLQSALMLALKNSENDSDSESSFSNLQILRDIVEYLSAGYSMKSELSAISSNISPKSHPSSSSLNRLNTGTDVPEIFPGRFLGNSHESMRSQECSGETSTITLSFGKADHGKLGLGASQVTLSLTLLKLNLLLNLLLDFT